MVSFLHSRKGVTQGDPLAMVDYGIDILPLIKNLKARFSDVTQTWFDENASSLGTLVRVKSYFNSLKRLLPVQGYCPKPYKIVLIFYTENLEAGNSFGLCNGF